MTEMANRASGNRRPDFLTALNSAGRVKRFRASNLRVEMAVCRACGKREDQGQSRLRPLARRLASTRRPPLVAMRARNPCVRLRCRLLGLNVRFMTLA